MSRIDLVWKLELEPNGERLDFETQAVDFRLGLALEKGLQGIPGYHRLINCTVAFNGQRQWIPPVGVNVIINV